MAGPIPTRHETIDDLDGLRQAIQTAIRVEFSTIPPYLSCLYSIQDKSSDAYQALRSVVVEEMFHVNQAANLLIGVGGQPKLTGDAVPTYPTYLPSASRTAQLPYVGLYRASQAVFKDVFMAIEMPAPFTAPAEGENYETIGQFYKAIEEGLDHCVEKYGATQVFKQAEGVRQRDDIYLGKFGGRAIRVHDLARARHAIRQIVEQGEGAVDPTRPLVAYQPWGTYDYYGHRLDGTYGPILGTPFELSHYFKFKRVAESGEFPLTYPTVSNPRITDFTNQEAKQAAVTFNKYYTVMLNSLERAFLSAPGDRDVYFEITLPLMHGHLPQLAGQLVMTPIMSDGDPSVGPNAAATFEYVPGASLSDLIGTVESLATTPRRAHTRTLAAARGPIASTALPVPAQRVRRDPEVLTKLADNLRQLHNLSEQAGFGL
jgi:hypothetical protein